MSFDSIFGNDTIKSQFQKELIHHTCTHAYIIEGKEGSGRTFCAIHFIAALACKSSDQPCLNCESCRKILGHESPDVHFISPKDHRQTIGVDAIRSIADSLYIKPNDLEIRAYIIKPAQKMTVQAQNALLKMLEEPPAGSVFFLIVDRAQNLLETIRSRCKILSTEPLSNEEMLRYLRAQTESIASVFQKQNSKTEKLLELFEGCIGKAIAYFDSEAKSPASGMIKAEETAKHFLSLFDSSAMSFVNILLYLNSRVKNREDYAYLLEKTSELLAAEIRYQKCGINEKLLLPTLPTAVLCRWYTAVQEHQNQQNANPPIAAALNALAVDLWQKI